MKNTFGNHLSLTPFGESHGAEIGCILDGLTPGMPVSEESISHALSLRRPAGAVSTARREEDSFRIVSGAVGGRATGTPLCILIPNTAQRSSDYARAALLRPGHADYTAEMKYHGFQDVRGGGHFSGRITAPLVAAGAILRDALRAKGIRIGTHVKEIAGIADRGFEELGRDLDFLENAAFPVLSSEKEEKMREAILAAKADGDSVGGVLETVVTGMPAGVGEPWFDSVEGLLSHALFSIPAVKGVEFGAGFGLAEMRGSEANDALYYDGDGTVRTRTNHNGGINGGITNGMPLCFSLCIKPTPTLSREQETVDLSTGKGATLASGGRHDPCIVHRAGIVVTSVTALVLCDALLGRFGTDFFSSEERK
ncbi:MAG: chorismate synthase [Clostridia bacterium]|nr:chorismate synthase [Clostridia bacterium]